MSADALGPKVVNYVLATRHIINDCNNDNKYFSDFFNVSSISTGVLGDTGIESAEIIKGVVKQINPDCVIAVDALAASSASRLGNTVQLCNAGISPGSGVGNHRYEISENTLGIPVISIGIPTVVSTSVIKGKNGGDGMFVTPREIDRIIEHGAKIVSNCKALAEGLLKRGNKLVSGGTDNHVLLMDLRDTGVTGKELEARLDECYITVNKNTIPGEPLSPFVTSGVRIGTAAVTTRGLNEEDMDKIAEYITLVLNDFENSADKVRAGVEEICKKYPLYE